MAWKCASRSVCFIVYLALLMTYFTIAIAKSHYPITDDEIRLKKNQCYVDIENGLWGWDCKASLTAKENCALRCLSPRCFELVYQSDPLEEGEKDLSRGQEYKYCMQRLSTGESLEGIRGSFDY